MENFVEDLPDLLAGKTLTAMLSDLLSTSADKESRRALYWQVEDDLEENIHAKSRLCLSGLHPNS